MLSQYSLKRAAPSYLATFRYFSAGQSRGSSARENEGINQKIKKDENPFDLYRLYCII